MTDATSRSRLSMVSAEVCDKIFQEALSFADYQLRRHLWRGQSGGVLPEGFDANSIAAEAIMQFLANSNNLTVSPGPLPFHHRNTDSPEHLPAEALHEIKRLILKQVTRLHHLKENFFVSNEADLCLVRSLEGEWKNPVEFIPAPGVQPDEALIRKESFLLFETLKFHFQLFLGKERRLKHLLDLNCDGIHRPQELAARLKLRRGTVENLQRKLQRKWLLFSKSRLSPSAVNP